MTIILILIIKTSPLMIKLCRRKLESWRGRRRALAFSTGCIIKHQVIITIITIIDIIVMF